MLCASLIVAVCACGPSAASPCFEDGGVVLAYKPLPDGGFDEIGCPTGRDFLGTVDLPGGKGVCCRRLP